MEGPTTTARPLPHGDTAHQAAHGFLDEEAYALDRGEFDRWIGMLCEDVRYRVPVRVTTPREVGFEELAGMSHMEEDIYSLRKRVDRLATEHAWAEEPPSRTRHLVTNVRTVALGEGEFEVTSNVLLVRSRGDVLAHDLLTAARTDVLRECEDGELRLARRHVLLDETVAHTQSFSFFL